MMCGFGGLRDRKRGKTNHCVIVLLDDTQLVHELHPHSTGQDLLDVVIKHLNLLETSYFGLKYLQETQHNNSQVKSAQNTARPTSMDSTGKPPPPPTRLDSVWLDMDRSALKQLRHIQPMTVYFGVKYYASDPCKLAEEITRYQFFLQCKQDILNARLLVNFELAIELFALAVQSELGDFDPQRHLAGYVSEFQFAPNQSMELEQRVAVYHQSELRGQVPATAELNFLERVRYLDLYGCQLHPIQYDDGETQGDSYAVGLAPSGVLVLRNRHKVAQYAWARIIKTKCEGRCFLMDVIAAPTTSGSTTATSGNNKNRFGFRLADKEASRRLRWAVEEHKSFYQLLQSSATLRQLAQRQHHFDSHTSGGSLKFSQRFRNSIRSAIGVPIMQQHYANQQPQKLRSSIKSLHNQQQQYAASMASAQDLNRQAPSVVRTPSRRYSRQQVASGAQLANGNGLPVEPMFSGAHTMADGQRQRALMLMSQWQQQQHQSHQFNNSHIKSQTLRPHQTSRRTGSGQRNNPYHEQMMMMMAASAAAAAAMPSQQQHQPEVAILPAGQHIVQPSIYKAKSMIGGMNQLRAGEQFFSKPDYQMMQHQQSRRGAESPARSTKSALVSVNKQQQQFRYDPATLSGLAPPIKQPVPVPQPQRRQQKATIDDGHNGNYLLQDAYYQQSDMTQQQPQLVRPVSGYNTLNARRAEGAASLSRRSALSKSTNDNLHLLHAAQPQSMSEFVGITGNNKSGKSAMLLTTAAALPPPDYNTSTAERRASNAQVSRRRSKSMVAPPSDDDYYCSRSDCSSIEGAGSCASECYSSNRRQQQQPLLPRPKPSNQSAAHLAQRQRAARLINGQLIMAGEGNNESSSLQRRRAVRTGSEWAPNQSSPAEQQSDARSQRQRRNSNNNSNSRYDSDSNVNNDLDDIYLKQTESGIIKNMANKQATPILLSMKAALEQQHQQRSVRHSASSDANSVPTQRNNNNNNSELLRQNRQDRAGSGQAGCAPPINSNEAAVQLLNLQRKQLNHNNRRATGSQPSATGGVDSAAASIASPSSASSSTPSSPLSATDVNMDKQRNIVIGNKSASNNRAGSDHHHHHQQQHHLDHSSINHQLRVPNTADSAASSASTATSGYYAGSNNSTGADSDNALDSNNNKDAGNYRSSSAKQVQRTACQNSEQVGSKQRFYLGANDAQQPAANKTGSGSADVSGGNNKRFSPALEQLQSHAPSSALKYVSFDV